MIKSRNTTTARDLRHAFTLWADDPTDHHRHERLKSIMQHWEIETRIRNLTTAKPPTMHAGATA